MPAPGFVCSTCTENGQPLPMGVLFTRRKADSVRRVRACPSCGRRVTTFEMPASITTQQTPALTATAATTLRT